MSSIGKLLPSMQVTSIKIYNNFDKYFTRRCSVTMCFESIAKALKTKSSIIETYIT